MAASTMVAGDSVLIRGGVYYESMSPAQSGTEADPITVSSRLSEGGADGAGRPAFGGLTWAENGLDCLGGQTGDCPAAGGIRGLCPRAVGRH
jgi:hypothetical protein